MRQSVVLLSSFLLLLLSFFSFQGSITGQVVRAPDLRYDVTADGVVDRADLLEVMDLASYNIYRVAADFTGDGVVDQADVDLLISSLPDALR